MRYLSNLNLKVRYSSFIWTLGLRFLSILVDGISGFVRVVENLESHGILEFDFPGLESGVGQGGGRPGEKGAGGVREAGEEGAGSGIPKVAGSRRKREKLRNIAQYFAIKKMQRGWSQKIQGGNRD